MEVHGAVQWLIKAYEDYRHRVTNHSISYKVFVEEYLVRLNMPIFLDESATYNDLLQEATDRDKVKHILENRKFTESNFASDSFAEADAIGMIAKYNAIGTKETAISETDIPINEFPQEVKDGLSEVFRKYKLLSPDITSEDLVLLLTTGKPFRKYKIASCSRNGDIGLVINILLSIGALAKNAISTICSPGMLLTMTDSIMARRNLSAAIHKYDGYEIRNLDERLQNIERDTWKVLKPMTTGDPAQRKLL